MDISILKIVFVLSLALFLLPKRYQYFFGVVLHSALIAVSSFFAINAITQGQTMVTDALVTLLGKPIHLVVDHLTAFFILVVNFTMLTGLLYARGYLKPYHPKKDKTEMALHYFSFLWLHGSMLLACMARDALAFLLAWELMSISSFFLVIFDSEKQSTIKAGLNYLLQMHIGFVFILTGFLFAHVTTGAEFSFDGLAAYFQQNNPYFLFLLFFVGFGIKAGFIPLHTWLPHAHPAAPSHVSGVMSGVMIKMGIYGLLRVLTYIHTGLLPIGVFVLLVSILSGIFGVTMAIVQHDIKKLLAYHSIENIGIIGIGIGLGLIGLGQDIPVLAVLGFSGGILHILNHSLFKSLLFYSAGTVVQQTHSLNINHLGGLIKKMPVTAAFFLLGALAISGLPPFNGFISEFLIYSGMYKGLLAGNLFTAIIILFGFIALAVIGGLAIFCFTKVFSIVFLGSPRSGACKNAHEPAKSMLVPKTMAALVIIAIGLAPAVFVYPLQLATSVFTKDIQLIQGTIPVMNSISITSFVFLFLLGALALFRKFWLKKHPVDEGLTWGCGYTGANPASHQYTATSFANSIIELAPVVNVKKHGEEIREDEIFPKEREFETHSSDILEETMVSAPANKFIYLLEKIAVFQTGKLQNYLLYALLFLVAIFVLSLLKLM